MTNCRKCGGPKEAHTALNATTWVCPTTRYEPSITRVDAEILNADGTVKAQVSVATKRELSEKLWRYLENNREVRVNLKAV